MLCRGDSFHFAHRFRDESLKESIRRHEYFLALKLHLTKADKASACLPACVCGCCMPRGEAPTAAVSDLLNSLPSKQVLDVGCGIGGPLRAISGFSGAKVVGVNNNSYQVRGPHPAKRMSTGGRNH